MRQVQYVPQITAQVRLIISFPRKRTGFGTLDLAITPSELGGILWFDCAEERAAFQAMPTALFC
jgi:hypothetical protein